MLFFINPYRLRKFEVKRRTRDKITFTDADVEVLESEWNDLIEAFADFKKRYYGNITFKYK